jgi:choice-of-anchor B domain-containing protein
MTPAQLLTAFLVGSGLSLGLAAASTEPIVSNSEAMSAYGRAVAVAGEFAFVGEPSVAAGGRGGGGGGGGRGGTGPAAGIVYVYRLGTTGWKEADKLTAAASSGGDGFGSALAAEGTTLLVGQVRPAPGAGGGGGGRGGRGAAPVPVAPPVADTAVGTVQVFRRGADMKWAPAGALVGTTAGGAQFGSAIALAGNLALVGAPGEESGGAVYVFQRATNGQWSAAGSLPAQGLVSRDRFGAAIAIDGNRIAVGAPSRRVKGAVFVFRKDSTGAWVQETEQVAPGNLPDNAGLGTSVAVKGDRVMAGAPGTNFTPVVLPNPVRDSLLARLVATPPGASRDSVVAALATAATGRGGRGGGGGGRGGAQVGLATGMVLAYQRASFGSWRMVGTLAPFDFGNVNFGAALGVVGEELWIGAPGSDGFGRIYRVTADKDGGWSGMTKLGIDTIDDGAQLAASFAVSGNVAVVGMPGDGAGGGTVAFLGKTAAGAWTLRGMSMPPVPERYAQVMGKPVPCTNGMTTAFECGNTELLSFMPLSAIGARRGVGLSGNWGWTDPVTGKDYAIIGRQDGTAFVDVTDPVRPRYLGDLMRTKGSNRSSWREIKTYKNYALIVSDGSGDHHGIQIFDLTRLRNVTTPRRFTEDAHFDAGSIHDIAVNQESGFAYAAGTASGGETCSGGLLMIDMKVPLKPTFAGCFADTGTGRAGRGYTHDVQCVTYKGPDKRYTGHEICMASNETTVSIQDVTDKKNVKVLSHADYPTPGYTHQGWFTEDQKYWYLNDELDETGGLGRAVEGSRTMIFDVTDLQQPIMVKEFIGTTKASDHNLYVKGDRMYQSNYRAGLRIIDISDPVNPKEIGFLDTQPGENGPGFSGSWNNYPFFKNGAIGVSSGSEGFFMVRDVPRKIVP